ncbi:RNA polymerase sigma factor [Actinomarinicola tropica]|uniref:RNA polymerase sigma factor n=1 Tax=Actinomarinicola tropica TaxID=2789776 RepID=UPI00189BE1E2|nr:sigma-70 family RNA polymerase sigma factor [Actinomarinicola tropica]
MAQRPPAAGYGGRITPPADDRTLIHAAQAGDRRALDALLRRHQDRIYAVCRRLAGNDADALDATQDALIAIVRGLPRFDHRSAFSTWAYRVATNACLDELRRRSRRPVPGGDEELADVIRARDDDQPSLDTTTAHRLDIDAALSRLPEDFRAPVVLRDQLGLDYAEIAEVLGIPPGTVRSRIARGRSALARSLDAGNQDALEVRPTTDP